jgi:hypothetical protein
MIQLPDHLNEQDQEKYRRLWLHTMQVILRSLIVLVVLAVGLFFYAFFGDTITGWFEPGPDPIPAEVIAQREAQARAEDPNLIENGIHVQTGLIAADNWELVKNTCTACHSAKLVTQNRATRDGWKKMIVWMQETQGLWDLGDSEAAILDYLAANYAPEEEGRRPNLDVASIEWYILDLD